jgi:hypothetical protein
LATIIGSPLFLEEVSESIAEEAIQLEMAIFSIEEVGHEVTIEIDWVGSNGHENPPIYNCTTTSAAPTVGKREIGG